MTLRPTRRVHRQEDSVHLNITPFLDILVCLILFLISSAAFVRLAALKSSLPSLTDDFSQISEEKIVVTVKILEKGFEVGRVGQDTKAGLQKLWGKNGRLGRLIPLTPLREYDFRYLNLHMFRVKQVYPKADTVLLFPDEGIAFEVIVKAMDATREIEIDQNLEHEKLPELPEAGKGKRLPLFPEVVFGHQAEGQG